MGRIAAVLAAAAVFVTIAGACATSPTGRKQLLLVSESEMDAMGAQAFSEMKQQTPTDSSANVNAYVRCVVDPIAQAAKGRTDVDHWEVVVFKDDTPNAFALPGGKIGVHTGILPVAKTDAQLAAVLGHEVGHVIARHGGERVSTQLATSGGLAVVDAFILGKSMNPNTRGLIMAGLGLGAQVGVELPFSRTQESEADLIGLKLMAQAGFDPRQSVELWKNMIAASGAGGAPPAWLSTHPASEDRIQELQKNMPAALAEYEKAKAAGHQPHCHL